MLLGLDLGTPALLAKIIGGVLAGLLWAWLWYRRRWHQGDKAHAELKDAIEKLDAGNAHLRSDLRAARERLVKLHHERAAVDDRIPSRVAAHALLLAAKGAETERQALLAGWLGGAGSEASRALKELGEWYALFVTDEGETGAFAASRAVETLALAAALDPANADAAELLEAVEPGADLAALKAGLDMPLTLPAGLRPEEAESVAEQLLARSPRGLHIAERTGLSDSQVALQRHCLPAVRRPPSRPRSISPPSRRRKARPEPSRARRCWRAYLPLATSGNFPGSLMMARLKSTSSSGQW